MGKRAHFGDTLSLDTQTVGVAVLPHSVQPWAMCSGGVTGVPASLCWGQICSTDPCTSPHCAATAGSRDMIPATQHLHLRGAPSKTQTVCVLLNAITCHEQRAVGSTGSPCQRGIDLLDSQCPVTAVLCNTKKCQNELSGKALVVPNSSGHIVPKYRRACSGCLNWRRES